MNYMYMPGGDKYVILIRAVPSEGGWGWGEGGGHGQVGGQLPNPWDSHIFVLF